MSTDSEWLQSQLDRYTYRSGWAWTLHGQSDNYWSATFTVEITFSAVDAHDPSSNCVIFSRQAIPPFVMQERDPELFKRWFQTTIFNVEMHESREWLRRDGVLVEDPHKDQQVNP